LPRRRLEESETGACMRISELTIAPGWSPTNMVLTEEERK